MTLIVRGATTEDAAKPATRPGAHAEGTGSATGTNSHAEGTSSASGANSHAEGANALASGVTSHAEGSSTASAGTYSHAEGNGTTASGSTSHAQGTSSQATGANSHAQGSNAVAHRRSQSSIASTAFAVPGDEQAITLVTGRSTSDATPSVLSATNGDPVVAATDSDALTIPASRGFRFRIEAVARNTATGAGEFAGWTITGAIVRGSTGDARFLGTPVVVTESDAGASTWTLAVSVNTTNATYNYLALTATGEAAKTIRWVAALYATEVG